MRVVDVRQSPGRISAADVPRAESDIDSVMPKVQAIVEAVRLRGEEAVLDFGATFDAVRPEQLRVPASVLDEALERLDPQVKEALSVAIERVRTVHSREVPSDVITDVAPGARVTQRWVPVDRVGLYVPGGRAVYPSSVVMNVVPAQLAGVESLAITSPGQASNSGWPDATILAAAALLGIDEVYACGGAQAIAWLALGPRPVSLVTGPGNLWVTAAKRLLSSVVGIDSEAGPTEIMIIADESANPAYVAADLISQAEHDVVAASVLVTDSARLVEEVAEELNRQVRTTRHRERITEALTGTQSAAVLVSDMDQAVVLSNTYGPEHLEIHTTDPRAVSARIRNAGAVFLGNFTPVSLGDYCAGSNHVLPTGGCACHSSGLGVHSFLRSMQEVEYTREALEAVADTVVTLARAEDLPAHGEAVTIRGVASAGAEDALADLRQGRSDGSQ